MHKKRKRDRSPASFAILIVVLTVPGIALLGFAEYLYHAARAVDAWATTDGTIVDSEIIPQALHHTEEGTYFKYRLSVTYTYTVAEEEHQGHQVMLRGPGNLSHSAAQLRLARYPAGKHVEVFYNPDNPTQAVLERGTPASNLRWWLAGLFWVTFGGIVLAANGWHVIRMAQARSVGTKHRKKAAY